MKNNIQSRGASVSFEGLGILKSLKNPILKIFKRKSKYDKALNYLERQKTYLRTTNGMLLINQFDLKKLDGIQEGLKSFQGLSMKKIVYITQHMDIFAMMRHCSGRCSYCVENAMPKAFKPQPNTIDAMAWEDFDMFMSDLSTLKSRMGFNFLKRFPVMQDERYLFSDNDCVEQELKDKSGRIYDFEDISEKFYKSTGLRSSFDTSGWTPSHKKMQERAEKLVKYFEQESSYARFAQVNISINPFHGLNTKAVKYLGNNEAASEKMRNLYTDRIANAIFTFTPIINLPNFNFIVRALEDSPQYLDGFKMDDTQKLINEIIMKVEKRYKADLAGEKKYIKDKGMLTSKMNRVKEKIYESQDNEVVPIGRGINFFSDSDSFLKRIKGFQSRKFNYNRDLADTLPAGLIDANGKFYILKNFLLYPTDISLNFMNKNKETKPFGRKYADYLIKGKIVEKKWENKL